MSRPRMRDITCERLLFENTSATLLLFQCKSQFLRVSENTGSLDYLLVTRGAPPVQRLYPD